LISCLARRAIVPGSDAGSQSRVCAQVSRAVTGGDVRTVGGPAKQTAFGDRCAGEDAERGAEESIQMNKWLGGGVALGLGAAGTLILAGPGSAQAEPLGATIEPATVEQGGTVTLTSVDACVDGGGVPGNLVVDIFFENEEEPFQSDPVDLAAEDPDPEDPSVIESPDGQWALEYTGEAGEPIGTYTYVVTCFADDQTAIGEYAPLVSEVVEATTPTTTPPGPTPPAPAPAPPVSRTPDFTG
jgi:hypothetical protein